MSSPIASPDDLASRLAAAVAARAEGAYREAAAHARNALACVQPDTDPGVVAEVQSLLAFKLVRLGELEEAVSFGQQALAVLQQAGRPALLSDLLGTLSLAYERAGLDALAASHAAQALDVARGAGDRHAECGALIRLACSVRDPEHGPRALEMLEHAAQLAAGLPDAELLRFTASNNLARRCVVEADHQLEAGHDARAALERGHVHARAAAEKAKAAGRPGWLANAWANLAGIHRRLGQTAEAHERFAAALQIAEREGYRHLAATLRLARACMDLEATPSASTRQALEALMDAPVEGTDPDLLLQARRALVQGCRTLGDAEAALDHLERLHAATMAEHTRRADLQARLLFNQAELAQARHEAERARLDAEVLQLRAETAQLAKRRFLSTASHELRTPVNGLLGMVEAARRRATDARQIEQLQLASTAGHELAELLALLLEYVAADDPRLATRQPTDVRALLSTLQASATLAPRLQELGLVVDVAPRVPASLLLEAHRLQRVLEALLGNAMKFATAGPVIVSADWEPTAGATPRLLLEVIDAGPGMAPELQARLFQLFEPGDTSNTRTQRGLGMGLALVRRLTQAMGGEVSLTSAPGQGSCFRLWLPAPVPSGSPDSSAPAPALTPHGTTPVPSA